MNTKDLGIEFKQHKLFDFKDEFCLYFYEEGKLFKIDERVVKILKMEGRKKEEIYSEMKEIITFEEFEDILNQLQLKEDMSYTIKAPCQDLKQREANLGAVTLMIAQECNLKCKYCYGEGGEYQERGKMTSDIAIKAVDFLIENTQQKELLIVFFGGEPLMNFDLIKVVVEYCKDKEKHIDKKFRFSMTTNGTLINDEIEEYIRENNIFVQISIDGRKEVNDINRFNSNGEGIFDKVIAKTGSLRTVRRVSARATISKDNLNLCDNFTTLDQLNFSRIPMVAAQNLLSDEDYDIFIKEQSKLIELLEKMIKSKEFNRAKKMSIQMTGLKKIHNTQRKSLICGVGSNFVAIDIKGNIFPCHRFVANKGYSLGSIIHNNFDNNSFVEQIRIKNHTQCQQCWAKLLCMGHCPNENLVNSGDINYSLEKVCKSTKAMYKDLIRVYMNLSEEEKLKLF